jgi:hypothetical protein
MSGTYGRVWRTPRRMTVIAAVVVAAVLAAGAGVWWGLAGAGEQGSTPAGAASPPSGAPGDAEPTPGASTAPDGSAPAGTPGGDDPAGAGQPGGGAGAGQGGEGGAPANRAPVIEDPDLSSNGLTLSIKPTVTDPDDDEVTLVTVVDGEEISPNAMDPDSEFATFVRFDRGEVGYTHTARIELSATDSRGATTERSFFHELAAITTVTVRDMTFKVRSPSSCFADEAARRLTADVRLVGAVTDNVAINEELRADRPSVVLLDRVSGQMTGNPTSQRIFFSNGAFAGELDSASFSHTATDGVLRHVFGLDVCRGVLTYRVDFAVR